MEVILRAHHDRPLTALRRMLRAAEGGGEGEGKGGGESGDGRAVSAASARSRVRPGSADSVGSLLGLGPGRAVDEGPPLDEEWDYAYCYRYEGLRLKDPKRVRRRRSWAARAVQRVREERAAQARALAEHEEEQARRLLNAQGGAALQQMGGAPAFGSSTSSASAASATSVSAASVLASASLPSQSLVLAVPKGPAMDPAAAGRRAEAAALHRLPLRPHRPRRNSFDLISLARAHPDQPDYDDGWETCDSEDERYHEAFGFYDDEGREGEAKAEREADALLHVSSGAAPAQMLRKNAAPLLPPAPTELGVASTFAIMDAAEEGREAAELAEIEDDFVKGVEREHARRLGAVVATKAVGVRGLVSVAEGSLGESDGDNDDGDGDDTLGSIARPGPGLQRLRPGAPRPRPESAMERRVRRTRDFYLRKLARIHLACTRSREERARATQKLHDENVNERDLRLARDAYETTHGEGASARVPAWAALDSRVRERITNVFLLENRVAALEREARATTEILKGMDQRLLYSRRARSLRQAAVEDVRAADPSLLVLDFGSAVFRLADDAPERILQRYGRSSEDAADAANRAGEFLRLNATAKFLALADASEAAASLVQSAALRAEAAAAREEKKGDEGAGAGALSLVGVRAAPGRPRVADTGAAFHMPSTASGRPGGFAALAGDGRQVGYAPGVAAPGRDADEGTGAATDGGGGGGGGASPLDPRDAFALRADLVAANPLAPRGLRPAAARAVGFFAERPQSSSRVRMLPIRHSPYAILPGGVRVLLPNPNGVGGAVTESFGGGAVKKTALSRTLRGLGIDQDSYRGGGLLQPLTAAARPLEQLKSSLGSVAHAQSSKRKLPTEIGHFIKQKAEVQRVRHTVEFGAARRLRTGLARRIQLQVSGAPGIRAAPSRNSHSRAYRTLARARPAAYTSSRLACPAALRVRRSSAPGECASCSPAR